ncbi:hypothetical protein [Pseudomonas stutzeri]|uniref:hypothetical protein n=1 Tax=Stutzerimonas stutzeri TaxID=316 RepID=UPI0013A53697
MLPSCEPVPALQPSRKGTVGSSTGGAVTGRNNGAAGINVAATSAGYRCKNINIAAPCGYDDRATTAQQWGILVQGVDGCRLGKHIAFGNTTRNVSINRSATSAVEADTCVHGALENRIRIAGQPDSPRLSVR